MSGSLGDPAVLERRIARRLTGHDFAPLEEHYTLLPYFKYNTCGESTTPTLSGFLSCILLLGLIPIVSNFEQFFLTGLSTMFLSGYGRDLLKGEHTN
jgi:hypothetical protein